MATHSFRPGLDLREMHKHCAGGCWARLKWLIRVIPGIAHPAQLNVPGVAGPGVWRLVPVETIWRLDGPGRSYDFSWDQMHSDLRLEDSECASCTVRLANAALQKAQKDDSDGSN